jgi:hypothetical protein
MGWQYAVWYVWGTVRSAIAHISHTVAGWGKWEGQFRFLSPGPGCVGHLFTLQSAHNEKEQIMPSSSFLEEVWESLRMVCYNGK